MPRGRCRSNSPQRRQLYRSLCLAIPSRSTSLASYSFRNGPPQALGMPATSGQNRPNPVDVAQTWPVPGQCRGTPGQSRSKPPELSWPTLVRNVTSSPDSDHCGATPKAGVHQIGDFGLGPDFVNDLPRLDTKLARFRTNLLGGREGGSGNESESNNKSVSENENGSTEQELGRAYMEFERPHGARKA